MLTVLLLCDLRVGVMHMKETQGLQYMGSYSERALKAWQQGYEVRENKNINS